MTKRYLVAFGVLMACVAGVQAQQQKGDVRVARPVNPGDFPEHMRPEAKIVKGYVPPKTAWGDPQLAGAYTNSDESGIPFERPAQFDGKKLADVTPEQLAQMQKQRQDATLERAPTLSEFPGAAFFHEPANLPPHCIVPARSGKAMRDKVSVALGIAAHYVIEYLQRLTLGAEHRVV